MRPTVFCLLVLLAGCSFDYGTVSPDSENRPDLVMNQVEYVRVQDGDPIVRFTAETAERYDKRQTMELKNFSFEQFGSHGAEINAAGRVGNAHVELDSGNIQFDGGINIVVESEDITIETQSLSWQDKERFLTAREMERVEIHRSDGTSFSGQGFSADIRSKTWVFSGGIQGTYVHEDEEEADEETSESGAEGEDEETPE